MNKSVSDLPPLKCSCPPDWTGERCETRVTPCEDRCQNGGSCIQSVGGTFCVCPSGFAGEFCENCPSLNCLNGAFCRALEKDSKTKEKENRDKDANKERKFVCSCPPGYFGDRCERSECDNYCLQVKLIWRFPLLSSYFVVIFHTKSYSFFFFYCYSKAIVP